LYASASDGLYSNWVYNIPRRIAVIYFMLFSAYWFILLNGCFIAIRDAFEMRDFYENHLKINQVCILKFFDFCLKLFLEGFEISFLVRCGYEN
jgi:hypothetical protein